MDSAVIVAAVEEGVVCEVEGVVPRVEEEVVGEEDRAAVLAVERGEARMFYLLPDHSECRQLYENDR